MISFSLLYLSPSKPIAISSIVPFCLIQWFSNFILQKSYMKVFFKHRMLGSKPRLSNSVGLGQDLKIFISSNFQGDAHAAGLGNTLRTTCLRKTKLIFILYKCNFTNCSTLQPILSYFNRFLSFLFNLSIKI